MSGEHTPGPWEWWTSNSWRRLRHSERGVSTDVLMPCVHNDGQPDIIVNAADMALIAAAPDLLAALQNIVPRFERCCAAMGSDAEYVLDATKQHRAAIAKATTPSR